MNYKGMTIPLMFASQQQKWNGNETITSKYWEKILYPMTLFSNTESN